MGTMQQQAGQADLRVEEQTLMQLRRNAAQQSKSQAANACILHTTLASMRMATYAGHTPTSMTL
jgi:hypothetical protein